MTLPQRLQYAVVAVAWLLFSGYFWLWWIEPANAGNRALFLVVSAAMFYSVTLLPSFYLFYLGQMRRPVPMGVRPAQQAGVLGRVAVISLTVPGAESLDIVRRQLAAMQAIRYPHDSWILVDKEHSPEIQYLAAQMGVGYFCRHDESAWGPTSVARWNAPVPPFQAKTKAGNVNSWLDRYGDFYTHFTQLDIDHHPVPSYLERVLGFFIDPKVAWVQAPSVYGNHEYWTARGSSEQEVVLQGPLQMGFFGFCRTPFIIGSHCTYDTRAILRIGGFQPTRAEDHLDTVCLAADGYQGVYLPEVIATGDGPETFGTYLAQQFAWAFSMIQVLFRYTPRLIRRYTPRQGLQFLFAQTWYTFWSLSMLIVFMSPLFSLVLNMPISHVTLWNFFLHTMPATVTATVVWWWSKKWHQPKRVSLSWRGIVLHMARWVIVLSAFVQVILRVKKPYMITVKGLGADVRRPFKMGLVAPYLGLFAVSIGACWFYLARYNHSSCQGYLFFGLEDAALFLVLITVIFVLDIRELLRAYVPLLHCLRLRVVPLLITVGMVALLVFTAAASYSRILEAVSGGMSWPFHVLAGWIEVVWVTVRIARGLVCASAAFLAASSLTSCSWLTHRSGPANTYYLSPSGNDSAAGTSPATAWRSLGRASAARLQPGMRLLLQGGGRFPGELLLGQRDGGDPRNPIQIGSYGKGRATITSSTGPGIAVKDTGGVDISGLSVIRLGSSGQIADGVKVFSDLTDNRRLDHISISNVNVSGFANGISIGSLNGKTGFRGVSVQNSVVQHNLDTGLLVYGPAFRASAPNYANQDVLVSHVVAAHNPGNPDITAYSSGSGIILGSVQNGTVKWSTAADNGGRGASRPGPEGIWAYDSTHVVIEHCLSYRNRTHNRVDGNGFGLDENTSDSYLEYNLSYGNDGAGYLIYTLSKNGMTKRDTVRFNISSGDALDQNPSFGGITVGGQVRSTSVYQNTVVMAARPVNSSAALVLTRNVRDISVWNNIFRAQRGPVIAGYGASSAAALHLEGNDYSTATADWSVYWGQASYPSLPAWRLASGEESVSGHPVGSAADPRLTGPVLGLRVKDATDPNRARGFVLRPGSALNAAGLDLWRLFHVEAGPSDFAGTSVSTRHPEPGAQ